MSEGPVPRSAEEIYNDLLAEAEQQLKEVERELEELEQSFRRVKMVEFAARRQTKDILLPNEKSLLEEYLERREDVKRREQFWQRRLEVLQEYEIQSFERSYKYDTR